MRTYRIVTDRRHTDKIIEAKNIDEAVVIADKMNYKIPLLIVNNKDYENKREWVWRILLPIEK